MAEMVLIASTPPPPQSIVSSTFYPFLSHLVGAGISVSPPANIPDFRSSTGLFKRLKEKHPSAGLSSGKDLFDARLFQVSLSVGWKT